MKKIVQGVHHFHEHADRNQPLFSHLAEEGQAPRALLLTCVDSRLDPSMLMEADPGDILVHRNVGSVVPLPEVGDHSLGAAVEFALTALKIPNIVVMGHSHCGAMKAALAANQPYGSLHRWLDHAEPARQRFMKGDTLDRDLPEHDQLSQINVLQSIEHLARYPVVRERLDRMEVTIHGWWFHMPTATVLAYDPRTNRFLPVDEVYAEDLKDESANARVR